MNFQENLIENTARASARAAELASAAMATAKGRARVAAERVELLKAAGQKLNLVARRHATRFIKQNRTLVSAAGKDLSELARSTIATFTREAAPASPIRRKPAKRSSKKAR